MNFEHIVAINDPADPSVRPVSGESLWALLLLSVRDPRLLRPDLDHVEISAKGPLEWERRIDFGRLEVRDRVHADPVRGLIVQQILAPDALAGGSRSMAMEAPAEGVLVLRFSYHSPHIDADPEVTDAHRAAFRSAYLQADVAQVAMLRELIQAAD
ncbi:MAG: DUF1857 family protein [Rhodanobacteraceae bacterium]|nr:DUF1857 family protein [Rhodanobacteraceae bacterium]